MDRIDIPYCNACFPTGVRFSGGSKNNSGVFELVQDGRGEPFCGSSMQDFEAEIACREMG